MGNKLYVGNLAYSVRDESLQESFSQFGTVISAKVMMDRETGRSKGFGFVEMSTDAEAQAAIDAAQAAWAGWRNKTGKERSILLRKWYDLLMANVEDLGRLMTAEQGKPFAEAKGEVAYGASFVEWFVEEAKRVNGETLPQFANNRCNITLSAVSRVRDMLSVSVTLLIVKKPTASAPSTMRWS